MYVYGLKTNSTKGYTMKSKRDPLPSRGDRHWAPLSTREFLNNLLKMTDQRLYSTASKNNHSEGGNTEKCSQLDAKRREKDHGMVWMLSATLKECTRQQGRSTETYSSCRVMRASPPDVLKYCSYFFFTVLKGEWAETVKHNIFLMDL